MKKQLTIVCIWALLGIYVNNPADAGILKFTYYTSDGKCWELLTKEELMINENVFYIDKDSSGVQTNLKSTQIQPLDIRKFIKPEKEVEENIFDTKA